MPVAALAVGTVVSAVGSKKAAKKQVQSGDQAIAQQQQQLDQTRQDQAPFLQAGTNALGRLENPQENFQASTGYNFVRNEGQRDIGNSFAARGGATGGNALKALSEFNAGLASQEYGNWWNQQAGLAGMGQNSANALGTFGANAASNIGRVQIGQGDARASGINGVGNAFVNFGDQYAGMQEGGFNTVKKKPKQSTPYGYNQWGTQ